MTVLLTGGAGYIGSHTAVALIAAGHEAVIADNYCNSSPAVLERIEKITGRRPVAYDMDVRNTQELCDIMKRHSVECVIHFAGLKAVGESVKKPVEYYRNNLDATLSILESMEKTGVSNLVFSSSATVYGEESPVPYNEEMKRGSCSSPYGWTKSMSEQIMLDAARANKNLSVVLLRYFNPIGAHESGLIGEDPQGIPNNLMPYISQVAVGKLPKLTVFGNDYPTADGTCRRDYIHVCDLADSHVLAADYASGHKGAEIFNIGTGRPYSVLEIINAFEKASGVRIPYEIGARREGDLPEFWADPEKAQKVLGWRAKRSLADMCRDSWSWQSKNPKGYEG